MQNEVRVKYLFGLINMPEHKYRKMMIFFIVFFGISAVIAFFLYPESNFWLLRNCWWMLAIMCIEMVVEMLLYLNKAIRLAHIQLHIHSNLIRKKNKEVLDSINYAKRIQSAILPPIKLLKEYLTDNFILYKPKDIVAGDFYWIEIVEDKVFFTAADCTGHGVPGAMMSVMCSNALSKAVKELEIYQPAKILDKTVEILEEHFANSEEEVKDGMDIALCCLDLKNMKLQYAGANNPLYHISKGELKEIKPDKQPIGKYDDRRPYTNHSIDITSGDCFYIFTDGFADQFGGPNEKKFKYKPFKQLLLDNHNRPMNEQKDILDKTIENWKGQLEQVDDVCIIGLRI